MTDFFFIVFSLIRHSHFTFAEFQRRTVIRKACKAVWSVSESCFDIRFNPDVCNAGNKHTVILLSPKFYYILMILIYPPMDQHLAGESNVFKIQIFLLLFFVNCGRNSRLLY